MPKTNHRLQSMVLFLKKSRISAFFIPPFVPNPKGRFFASFALCTIIATPAICATYEYTCTCGEYTKDSYYYDYPMCTSPSTTNCLVSKTTTSISIRIGYPAGETACNFCGCRPITGNWEYVPNGTGIVQRPTINFINYDEYHCNIGNTTYENGCANGYYNLTYQGYGQYSCTACPETLISTDGTIMFPSTGSGDGAQYNDITDCYIVAAQSAGAKFQDNTGLYQITGDCYYSL